MCPDKSLSFKQKQNLKRIVLKRSYKAIFVKHHNCNLLIIMLFCRFTSTSGRKSNLENLAHLPIKIVDIVNGSAIYAQWNYRVLCHPLKRNVPTSRLRVVDDLANRMAFRKTFDDLVQSNAARFQVMSSTKQKSLFFNMHTTNCYANSRIVISL